jgi:putative oxidoreductase
MAKSSVAALEPYLRSIARIVIGFLFSLHGFQKLFGAFGGLGGKGARAELFSLMWTAGVLETFGGILLAVGLFTRPVAFVLAGQMAVAYFKQHAPNSFWPIVNAGELAALYCFVFLWFSAAGAGPLSADRLLGKKS